jgi:hypothetical protein
LSGKIPFNPANPDLRAVRQIVFERLRRDTAWNTLDREGVEFAKYVEHDGPNESWPGRSSFSFLAEEMFWQLVVEGILAPGYNIHNRDLPWFHITQYGRLVLNSQDPNPHDPTGYLARLGERIASPDSSVVAYLGESLETFRKGSFVASTVMLGIAAERVFLLLCESLENALGTSSEKTTFSKLLGQFSMRPKLDWVHNKIQQVLKHRPEGFPENATIMVVAIYDLMRGQRNELGHPRETPPQVQREDAFVNLQIFPRYYEIAEEMRTFLRSNGV